MKEITKIELENIDNHIDDIETFLNSSSCLESTEIEEKISTLESYINDLESKPLLTLLN